MLLVVDESWLEYNSRDIFLALIERFIPHLILLAGSIADLPFEYSVKLNMRSHPSN